MVGWILYSSNAWELILYVGGGVLIPAERTRQAGEYVEYMD